MIEAKLEASNFGARSVTISTPKIKIQTPNMAIISTATHYIDNVINSGKIKDIAFPPYPHDIYEVVRKEHSKNFRLKELRKPKVFEKKITGLKQDLRFQKDALKMFHYQKPDTFTEVTREDNSLLFSFQKKAGLYLIKIWDEQVTRTPKYFARQVDRFRELAEKEGADVMPVLEMGNPDVDNFKEKLNQINDLGIQKINVNAGSLFTDWKNYNALMNFTEDKDIWVHSSGLSRKWKSDYTTSEAHIHQKFGINSFSLEVFKNFLVKGKVSVFDRNPLKQKLFDQGTCGHLSLEEGITRYSDELNCDFVCCHNKTRSSFYKDYAKVELLPVFANVHEAFNSYVEMQVGRKRIQEQDFKEYIKGKDYLQSAFSKLDKTYNFGQKNLAAF